MSISSISLICKKTEFLNWKKTIHQVGGQIKTKNCEDYVFIQLDAVFYVLYDALSALTTLTRLVIGICNFGSLYHYFYFIHRKSEVTLGKAKFSRSHC